MDRLVAEVTAGCFRVAERLTAWESDVNYSGGSDWEGGHPYCVVFEASCEPHIEDVAPGPIPPP